MLGDGKAYMYVQIAFGKPFFPTYIETVLCMLHVECFDPKIHLGKSNLGLFGVPLSVAGLVEYMHVCIHTAVYM